MASRDEISMNLFGEAELQPISVVSRNDDIKEDNDKIHCHWVKYVESTYEEPLSLFDGFQEMKVISFSYNFSFVARLAEKFEHAQIILGADFVAFRMNQALAKQTEQMIMSTISAESCLVQMNLNRNQKLAKRVIEEEVELRFPQFLVDHRKIYLLKADDGRKRVIIPSANISATAWVGFNQLENYVVSDDPVAYDNYLLEFETAWSLSTPIIPSARIVERVADKPMEELPDKDLLGKEAEEFSVIEDNPIINSAQTSTVEKAIIVREVDDPEEKMEIIAHNKDLEILKQNQTEIFKGMKLIAKNDVIAIVPNVIKKYLFNAKKESMKKMPIEKVSLNYPRMIPNYETGEVYLDNEKLFLNPPDEEVRNDIVELLAVFSNFDNFVGKVKQAKRNHFKLMNAMFSSPFNAKLRCTAFIQDLATSGLPLYLLLNSPANCGKTFMVRYFLKMMTGKKRLGYKSEKVKSADLTAFQSVEKVMHKGVPIFIDEVVSSFKTTYGGMIRTADSCEDNLREYQPLTIFASNVISDPDESLRKRMLFLSYDIGLSSDTSRSELEALGKQYMKRIGTAFYRKYLSYMVPYVMSELDKIVTKEGITDKYYPELMQRSSEIIIQIIKDYGFDVPDYMKVLSWDEDYADNSKAVYDEVLAKIYDMYNSENHLFQINEKYVTISLSNDWAGQKEAAKWANLLPREIQAEKLLDANYSKIRMNRKELEEHLGITFSTGLKAKLKKLLS